MGYLESAVRRINNLYRAWALVRNNVSASGHETFRSEVARISENPIPYLRRIQQSLQRGNFLFDAQRAVLKRKSTGKQRPIVVSPIANRIVQRAILNVLQSDQERIASQLKEVFHAIRTPTSVGGVPARGVAYAMELVRKAIQSGATHYVRSDIRDFFMRIPKSGVVKFVLEQTNDAGFATLLRDALTTELENVEEIKEYLYLFPLDDVGVPQGSSLSAFAGNVMLRDFDSKMNGGNIVTTRYIDDFVILGPSQSAVQKAFRSGAEFLRALGVAVYAPANGSRKATVGAVSDGFEFLGCSIRHNGVAPSSEARRKILNEISDDLRQGREDVGRFCSTERRRRAEAAYVQTLSRLDRKVRGWGDSFAFCDVTLAFHQMDEEIDRMLRDYLAWCRERMRGASDACRRRALGIALLKDTPVAYSASTRDAAGGRGAPEAD